MTRFEHPREVRVFSVTKREGRTKAWRVRWRVDGREGEESFLHKTVAVRFKEDLARAHRDGEEFDSVSLLPRSLAKNATPRLDEWVHLYAARHFPKLAAKSRAALGDDLVVLLERCVEDAPRWSRAQRANARAWLAGKAQLDPDLADFFVRRAPRLERLDRPSLVCLRERLGQRVDGRGTLAGSTLTKCWGNVKQVLDAAADEGVIRPLDWPQARRGATRKSEFGPDPQPVGHVHSVEDLYRIVAACTTRKTRASARYRTMTAVAGYAGLRPGEVFALRAEDLVLPCDDFSFGAIRVREADGRASEVWMRPEDPDFTLPKTRGSVRDVPIPPVLVRELRHYLAVTGIVRGRLFVTEASTSAKHWPDSLRVACARVDLAPLAPYDLRRMYASHLSAAGVPLAEIARRMGNSVKTLLDHYILPVAGQSEEDEGRLREYYGAAMPEVVVGPV